VLALVPPSLIDFAVIVLLAGVGLTLIAVGWRLHTRRKASASPNPIDQAPSLSAGATLSATILPGASSGNDASESFFGSSRVTGSAGAPLHGSSRPSQHGRRSVRSAAGPVAFIVVGSLMVSVALFNTYRNWTKEFSDFGMPERLLGMDPAEQGSVLGQQVEDVNSQDRDGLDVRAALYGDADSWVYVQIAEGDGAREMQEDFLSTTESAMASSGGGLTRGIAIPDWSDVDPGPLGGEMRCGAVPLELIAACAWTGGDEALVGLVIFAGNPAHDFAETALVVRGEVSG
jgi:hypothetical protein